MIKKRRCPNGYRRNKKTGECEPKKPKFTYENGYKLLNYNSVYRNIYNNPEHHKYKSINYLVKSKPSNYKNGVVNMIANVEANVFKNKLMNNKETKPKPFKINPKLKPIINAIVKANNLNKVNKLNIKNVTPGGLKFVEDYVYLKDLVVMYQWLISKYKKVMNEDMYYIEVTLTKQGKIYYPWMKKCLTQNGVCMKKGLLHYAKYCKQTIDDNKIYYITPLTLFYSHNNKLAHQNVLIHDLRNNIIYRFEPHGWQTAASSSSLDSYLKNKITESYKRYKLNHLIPKYIPSKDIMPRHGPQFFDITQQKGRCVIWTQAFLHYRLQYKFLTEAQIFHFLGLRHVDKLKTISKSQLKQAMPAEFTTNINTVTSFIKRYSSHLKSQKYPMRLHNKKSLHHFIKKQYLVR